jgi:hypothetical protein
MDNAYIVLEDEGHEFRIQVTEATYRQFLAINPELPHRLICPDPNCGGAVYVHTEAKNRREGAAHAYTEKGFSHAPHSASDKCELSRKNDPRFADLKDNEYAEETRQLVHTVFSRFQESLIFELQGLFGPKADCEGHFKKMRTLLAEHEFYGHRARVAPYAYAARCDDFPMILKNGREIRAIYAQENQQSTVFKSIRGHNRVEWIPGIVHMTYWPSLKRVPTYRFGIDFPDGNRTRIWRDMTSGEDAQPFRPGSKRFRVLQPKYVNQNRLAL